LKQNPHSARAPKSHLISNKLETGLLTAAEVFSTGLAASLSFAASNTCAPPSIHSPMMRISSSVDIPAPGAAFG
jgi:hypothetical protein